MPQLQFKRSRLLDAVCVSLSYQRWGDHFPMNCTKVVSDLHVRNAFRHVLCIMPLKLERGENSLIQSTIDSFMCQTAPYEVLMYLILSIDSIF